MIIFIQINTFEKLFLVWKGIMRVFFKFIGMLSKAIIFLVWKRVIRVFSDL